jgi:hypothetical protein
MVGKQPVRLRFTNLLNPIVHDSILERYQGASSSD